MSLAGHRGSASRRDVIAERGISIPRVTVVRHRAPRVVETTRYFIMSLAGHRGSASRRDVIAERGISIPRVTVVRHRAPRVVETTRYFIMSLAGHRGSASRRDVIAERGISIPRGPSGATRTPSGTANAPSQPLYSADSDSFATSIGGSPRASRSLTSSSSARSLFSRRKRLAFSRPCPSRTSPQVYQAPLFCTSL